MLFWAMAHLAISPLQVLKWCLRGIQPPTLYLIFYPQVIQLFITALIFSKSSTCCYHLMDVLFDSNGCNPWSYGLVRDTLSGAGEHLKQCQLEKTQNCRFDSHWNLDDSEHPFCLPGLCWVSRLNIALLCLSKENDTKYWQLDRGMINKS